mgnify:CR=1 FL=1
MNKILNQIQKLCSPARLYFILSVVSFLAMFVQNCQDSSSYNIGTFSVDSPCHNGVFFLMKAGYIIAWTYLLNLLCKKGFKTVSWALVLLPFVGMFIAIGLLMFLLLKRENFEEQEMAEDDDEEAPMGGGDMEMPDMGDMEMPDMGDMEMGDMGDSGHMGDMDQDMEMPDMGDMEMGDMMGEGEMPHMGETEEEPFQSGQWPQVGGLL